MLGAISKITAHLADRLTQLNVSQENTLAVIQATHRSGLDTSHAATSQVTSLQRQILALENRLAALERKPPL